MSAYLIADTRKVPDADETPYEEYRRRVGASRVEIEGTKKYSPPVVVTHCLLSWSGVSGAPGSASGLSACACETIATAPSPLWRKTPVLTQHDWTNSN
jgi:hypothetical protein